MCGSLRTWVRMTGFHLEHLLTHGEVTSITVTDIHRVSAGEMLSTEEGWVGSCPLSQHKAIFI